MTTLQAYPNSIVTVEQLHAWTGVLLARIYPNLAVLETDARSEAVVQTQIFTAADNSTRLLIRSSLNLDPSVFSDRSKKLWMFANEFGNVVIPSGFLSN